MAPGFQAEPKLFVLIFLVGMVKKETPFIFLEGPLFTKKSTVCVVQ